MAPSRPLSRHRARLGGAGLGLVLLAMTGPPAQAAPPPATATAPRPEAVAPPPAPATLTATRRSPPAAFGLMLNPVETTLSALINDVVVVSPLFLLGAGHAACVLVPQAYGLTDHAVGGAGAQVGFRVFSGPRYDGLHFGVRFGGGVGNREFKTFMGEIDAGWTWAFGAFRLGLGIVAGGGYYAWTGGEGSLYLFSVDLSVGFAVGRFQ